MSCISIYAFTSLLGIPIWIMSSVKRLNFFIIIATVKKYKLIIQKKKNKHDKIVLLAKIKSNSIELLISKFLIELVMMNFF